MKTFFSLSAFLLFLSLHSFSQNMFSAGTARVTIADGTLEGTVETSGIKSYKGIPFAAPPLGALRWKTPQPVQSWTGIRDARHFGHKGMQKPIYGDMNFRADTMSEDCLYLNVWVPPVTAGKNLPVLVYFYGGGFRAGDGSEPRYDGESMAEKGIVTLTVTYRLGIFGFFAHPELSAESGHNASGNYGLWDQYEALKWVQKNIAAFGGDPKRVTIAGESAGSIAVFAQMASPFSKSLFAGAIGESGAMIYPTLPALPLTEAENKGKKFADSAGARSLNDLRAMPAAQLLDLSYKYPTGANPTVDGYFFPESPAQLFSNGKQAHVPLLVGWNSAESSFQDILKSDEPSPENYAKAIRALYGERADEVLKLYPGSNQEEVIGSATALASDRFIAYSTWKWADLQSKNGGKPVYRYLFSKLKPPETAKMADAHTGLAGGIIKGKSNEPVYKSIGAPHSFEIEYAMGNLNTNSVYAFTPDDYKVSRTMENYFANFIKTGDPNGAGLPVWPVMKAGVPAQVININVKTQAETEKYRARYLFLDKIYSK